MDGKKYEKRVAQYLSRKGFKRITITKASNDYGVDVIAYKRREKYAVQCKYYSKPVGVHAVQQVVGGMRYYECDRAMVVTNNTYTRQAIELAERNDVILIEKMNGKVSIRMIYLRLIVLLFLMNLLFTEYMIFGLVGLGIYAFVRVFGIYVRCNYKHEIREEVS